MAEQEVCQKGATGLRVQRVCPCQILSSRPMEQSAGQVYAVRSPALDLAASRSGRLAAWVLGRIHDLVQRMTCHVDLLGTSGHACAQSTLFQILSAHDVWIVNGKLPSHRSTVTHKGVERRFLLGYEQLVGFCSGLLSLNL